jgi:hypothetical protein
VGGSYPLRGIVCRAAANHHIWATGNLGVHITRVETGRERNLPPNRLPTCHLAAASAPVYCLLCAVYFLLAAFQGVTWWAATLGASISAGIAASTGETVAATHGATIADSLVATLAARFAKTLAGPVLISVLATVAESLPAVYCASHPATTSATLFAILSASILATTAASTAATVVAMP